LASFVYHKEKIVQTRADVRKIVILGVGNLLLRDEGIGIHVIRALSDKSIPANIDIEIIDGGTSSDALHSMVGVDKLIIIDAVQGGGNPGAVYRFRIDDVVLEGKYSISLHQIDLFESLKMMEYLGGKPKDTVIIGVEPKEIEWGLRLSPELEQKVSHIVEIVLKEVTEEITEEYGIC